jgi:hypothetical protein
MPAIRILEEAAEEAIEAAPGTKRTDLVSDRSSVVRSKMPSTSCRMKSFRWFVSRSRTTRARND